jgi:hypothetical protein
MKYDIRKRKTAYTDRRKGAYMFDNFGRGQLVFSAKTIALLFRLGWDELGF